MLADFGSTLHAALANIEKFGSLRLGGVANWRMLIIPAPQRCQLGRHHGDHCPRRGSCRFSGLLLIALGQTVWPLPSLPPFVPESPSSPDSVFRSVLTCKPAWL